jgi:hypothetical protein
MTNDQYRLHFHAFVKQCEALGDIKGPEYANSEDRLGNFKRTASRQGTLPVTVLHTYLTKHLDSIDRFVTVWNKKGLDAAVALSSEPIEGRLHDAVNYLVLLGALISEERTAMKGTSLTGLTTTTPFVIQYGSGTIAKKEEGP